jgi:hypothetical protein
MKNTCLTLFLAQAEEFRLYSFKFLDHRFTDSTTVKIVLRMFLDFDLVSRFKIPYQVQYRRNGVID